MKSNNKTDKNTRILMLYHWLLNGHHVNKDAFVNEHGINGRTFDRDIEDIRLFLSEIYSADEVVFDKQTKAYYLTGETPGYSDRMEAAIISKILLESAALREDEMMGLLQTVLSTVSSSDARAINEYLKSTKAHYDTRTKAAILKLIGDLYTVIDSGTDIETFMVRDKEEIKVRVAPIEIELCNGTFHLVCAEDLDYSKIVRYRIEDILGFKKLKSKLAQIYKKKYYEEKEKKHGN